MSFDVAPTPRGRSLGRATLEKQCQPGERFLRHTSHDADHDRCENGGTSRQNYGPGQEAFCIGDWGYHVVLSEAVHGKRAGDRSKREAMGSFPCKEFLMDGGAARGHGSSCPDAPGVCRRVRDRVQSQPVGPILNTSQTVEQDLSRHVDRLFRGD